MASSSSSSAEAVPPWVELPREITAAIFHKLGTVEILMTVRKVCTTWRRVCQDPSMWRRIHIPYSDDWATPLDLDRICRNAVDLSQGHLTDVNIECYVSDDLLLYISQRSSQLSRLQLRLSYGITAGGLKLAVQSLPLLEELHLYLDYVSIDVENVGLSCQLLKSFKLNGTHFGHNYDYNAEALAIARSMPKLRRLELVGNAMTDKGLKAILDCCPHLESLDLRKCMNVQIAGDFGRLCSERIKDLRLPNDHMDDYPYPEDFEDYWDEDDNDYGINDYPYSEDFEDEDDNDYEIHSSDADGWYGSD